MCHLRYAASCPDIRFAQDCFGFLSQHFICPEFEASFINVLALAWLASVDATVLASSHLEIKHINFIPENIILCLLQEKLLADPQASMLSCVRLFVTPWTVAHQAPLSMEFSRQEYWSGVPFPSPGWPIKLFYFVFSFAYFLVALHSMCIFSPWTHAPCIKKRNLNHWATREVSRLFCFGNDVKPLRASLSILTEVSNTECTLETRGEQTAGSIKSCF